MKILKKGDFNFKKDGFFDPKRFDGYGNSISKKIWWLVVELDRMEQVQRRQSKLKKRYSTDRAIYNAAANSYNHAFELVCETFELFRSEKFEKFEYFNEFEYKRKRSKRLKRSMKLKLYKNEDWLRGKYEGEGLSTCQIAEICNVHRVTIKNYIDKFGINKRGKEE